MESRVAQRITRRRMQRTWSPPPVVSELLPDHGVDTDREISPLFPAHCSLRYCELWKLLSFSFTMPVDGRQHYDPISTSHHVDASRRYARVIAPSLLRSSNYCW